MKSLKSIFTVLALVAVSLACASDSNLSATAGTPSSDTSIAAPTTVFNSGIEMQVLMPKPEL